MGLSLDLDFGAGVVGPLEPAARGMVDSISIVLLIAAKASAVGGCNDFARS